MKKQEVKFESENDYAQSANTLFHFLTKQEYLFSALQKKAFIPRYCMEDISYLGIGFKEIAVLQKCFCDIPFHQLTKNFKLILAKDYRDLSDDEKKQVEEHNTHPDLYGRYAIAFSKVWGENNELQPVHYVNDKSYFTTYFSKLFTKAMSRKHLPNYFSADIMGRLSFMKPLRGIMKRQTINHKTVEVYKNFHDEREWRYLPKIKELEKLKLEPIIANPNVIGLDKDMFLLQQLNEQLQKDTYNTIWLKFNYNDIRYIMILTCPHFMYHGEL
mgnify:CR=1 FL=1